MCPMLSCVAKPAPVHDIHIVRTSNNFHVPSLKILWSLSLSRYFKLSSPSRCEEGSHGSERYVKMRPLSAIGCRVLLAAMLLEAKKWERGEEKRPMLTFRRNFGARNQVNPPVGSGQSAILRRECQKVEADTVFRTARRIQPSLIFAGPRTANHIAVLMKLDFLGCYFSMSYCECVLRDIPMEGKYM